MVWKLWNLGDEEEEGLGNGGGIEISEILVHFRENGFSYFGHSDTSQMNLFQ